MSNSQFPELDFETILRGAERVSTKPLENHKFCLSFRNPKGEVVRWSLQFPMTDYMLGEETARKYGIEEVFVTLPQDSTTDKDERVLAGTRYLALRYLHELGLRAGGNVLMPVVRLRELIRPSFLLSNHLSVVDSDKPFYRVRGKNAQLNLFSFDGDLAAIFGIRTGFIDYGCSRGSQVLFSCFLRMRHSRRVSPEKLRMMADNLLRSGKV